MLQFALGIRQKIGHWLNALKEPKPQTFSGPVAEKKSVLVVCDLDNEQDRQNISAMKAELKKLCPKATVEIACYYNKNSKSAYNLISGDEWHYFSEDRFSFFFKFKDDDLLSFLQKGYDIAIFLVQPNDVVANFASAYVTAALRVGWAGSELDRRGFLNLSVAQNANSKSQVADIIDSLKMLFA